MSGREIGERGEKKQTNQRLRLPAGKPVLISAGFQTHLLALFNIPVVKGVGLPPPVASLSGARLCNDMDVIPDKSVIPRLLP